MEKNTIIVSVNKFKTKSLLDSGASISCVTLAYIQKAGFSINDLQPKEFDNIIGVGGETHAVLGTIKLSIRIGNLLLDHKFHVFKYLHQSLILGIDFLTTHDCKIDFGTNTVTFKEGSIRVSLVETGLGYARNRKRCKIMPHQECDVTISVSKVSKNGVYLLEPVLRFSSVGIGAKCLVKLHNGKSRMLICNISEKPIFLHKNIVLAKAFSVDETSVSALDHSSDTKNSSQSKVSVNSKDKLDFDLYNADLTSNEKDSLLGFLQTQRDVFATNLKELGTTHLHHHRIDTGDASPVRMPFYRQSTHVREECTKLIDEMLDANIIQPCSSEWRSPVVMVKKKNGNCYRFAVDYRKLNVITKPIFYPLPRFDDVIDTIGQSKAKIFSVLDCASGFWQIPLDPETKHKSAFITQDGVFEFNKLPLA